MSTSQTTDNIYPVIERDGNTVRIVRNQWGHVDYHTFVVVAEPATDWDEDSQEDVPTGRTRVLVTCDVQEGMTGGGVSGHHTDGDAYATIVDSITDEELRAMEIEAAAEYAAQLAADKDVV